MESSGSGPELREQSTAELLKRLSQETTTLVRQELELAKAEVAEKARRLVSAPVCSAARASPDCLHWGR
jgi:hypothetical protein